MSSPNYNPVESQPIPSLLTEQTYSQFATLNVDTFIKAAGDRIREYCNWHIYPSITTTGYYEITGDGTILLPTRHLTGVTSVSPAWPDAPVIDSSCYHWDQAGWINFSNRLYGFAPSPATANLWPIDTVRLLDAYPKNGHRMQVVFTHGYDTVPSVVAEVGHELLMRTLEKPAGVASQVQAGPYRFVFQEFGMVLSADQKDRLAHYKLPGVY